MTTIRQKHMVSVIPVNSRGEVLLQQRDHAPGILYPGCWTIFGGAVEPEDASFEDAIRREIREELALDLAVIHWDDYVCPVRSIPGELDVIVHVFAADFDRPADSLTLLEGQSLGWFDAAGVAALDVGFEKKSVILRFLRERQGA